MSASLYPIRRYGRKPAFSSFLPGVAGERGIPLWCFYVNRGQCIAGFGSRDKQHSIMEFSPAHTAYQRVQTTGFRTFVKVDGRVTEPFRDGLADMHIGENTLRLVWESQQDALRMEISYFIVPDESIGMLARRVTLVNTADHPRQVEVLDGLAAIVPYGLSQFDLKMMCQTAKAWMMVEGFQSRLPYFRLRASLVDTTSVEAIEDGSFGAAYAAGARLPVVVDPAVVFGWDTSMDMPVGFEENALHDLLEKPQRLENELPCCFFGWEGELAHSVQLESVYGLSHGADAFHEAVQRLLTGGLDEKERKAECLLDGYLTAIETHTADSLFDRYCRQSYIDNFLRGGVPHLFKSGETIHPFYLYSRKHGDLERDYNDFVVTPEYYSQGNGNYRDVLQNRRSDVRFCPEMGWDNLKPFLELIQSDGYNPLVILPANYKMEDASTFDEALTEYPEARKLLDGLFTPGELAKVLPDDDQLLGDILCAAKPQVMDSFGEGYWVDHWVYLLDLLESCLSVYPEKKEEILTDRCLRWYESRMLVPSYVERLLPTPQGVRQFTALVEKVVSDPWMMTTDGKELLSTVYEKLFMLCVLKVAALDPFGEGVSMEAGKPGWYDALNGLPALFGSSICETCEIWRLVHFLRQTPCSLRLPADMARLAREMSDALRTPDARERWEQTRTLLEEYREITVFEVSPLLTPVDADEADDILGMIERVAAESVRGVIRRSDGVMPTYFTNVPSCIEDVEDEEPQITHEALPPFLEGPMHALRLPLEKAEKRAILDSVRASELYDEELKMYKVSGNLSGETPELGRANAFARGWLEHESIWLHMEYKYLLEMLKNGFYDDFFRDFESALIPFQPESRYGRSVLENCSFLASSANPDPATHGRGFVARLSGATAEFLDIWQTMFFGAKPFDMADGQLRLTLVPALPKRLIPEDGAVSAMFLGRTMVTYQLPQRETVTPETHRARAYHLTDETGNIRTVCGEHLHEQDALCVREGRVASIRVELEKR